jgi:predicted O-methyltransferase YrrM
MRPEFINTINNAIIESNKTKSENWFTYVQVYADFAINTPNGSTIVEVGSWKGRSSVFMADMIRNLNKNIKFYCVDTWEGSPEHVEYSDIVNHTLYDLFLDNTKNYKDIIIPMRKPSVEAAKDFANGSVDIVFIDACHEYECVKEDIAAWLPKVKRGGILAGHDYTWRNDLPVKRAVDEMLSDFPIKHYGDSDVWEIRISS